jgi:hypothetical protein
MAIVKGGFRFSGAEPAKFSLIGEAFVPEFRILGVKTAEVMISCTGGDE